MRARNFKPGLFLNEILGQEDPMLTLVFLALMGLADRDGLLEDRPVRIRAEAFPYRGSLDIHGYLTVLSRYGFIVRYENAGRKLISIPNFALHQSPHHTEKQSVLPGPEVEGSFVSDENANGCDITVSSPLSNGGNPPDSLNHDSLNQEVPPISPPRGARARKPKVELDCKPEIEPHIDAVFDLAPKAHPLTGEESPKGSRAAARRAFQKCVDSGVATPLELEWAGRIYFCAETMESEDSRLAGMCEKLYSLWPYRKKALKHVATFYGPVDKLYLELLPSARKLLRFLEREAHSSMPIAGPPVALGSSGHHAPIHQDTQTQPEPILVGIEP